MPGMKAMRHAVHGEHVNVGGQAVVDPAPQRFRGQGLSQIEVRHLAQRVHTRIGASRAHELEGLLARQLTDRALDLALHRARVLLFLPAAVPGTRVFDCELESRHASV